MGQNNGNFMSEQTRYAIRQEVKKVTEQLEKNKYMTPKTANYLLAGTVALSVIALPVAATFGMAALAISTAAAGSVTIAAALNKAKAVNMEISRDGFSGFISKAHVYLKEHSEVSEAAKNKVGSPAPEVLGMDFVLYKKKLEDQQELAAELKQQQRIESQSQPKQDQDKVPHFDFDMHFR